MSEITVHVVVTDANGMDSDVRVSAFLRPGQHIPERINVLAAEAAALAYQGCHLDSPDPIHRDYRKARR